MNSGCRRFFRKNIKTKLIICATIKPLFSIRNVVFFRTTSLLHRWYNGANLLISWMIERGVWRMSCRLSNGVLSVDIADIGEDYKGTRFDWTGFITQVTLEKGNHTFCVPESLKEGEGTGGSGLCNEFGISRAIGYDEAPIGGWFPKPGIGLLQKLDSQSYSFISEYPLTPLLLIWKLGMIRLHILSSRWKAMATRFFWPKRSL